MPITYASLLIVSDDPQALTALDTHLRELALYKVTLSSTLVQAEALAAAQLFDLVLLDVGLKSCVPLPFFDSRRYAVPVPVVVFGRPTDIPALTACVQQGAQDYLLLPTNPTFLRARIQVHLGRKRLQEQALSALSAFNEVEKLADDLRLVILPLGIALSSGEDFDRLAERFLDVAMELCGADAGSLFLRTAVDLLHYQVLRVDSLGLAYGGATGREVPFADLPLYGEEGEAKLDNVATFVAHEAVTVNIADVYDEAGFDFSGTRAFDARNGYRTISCLTVPLQTDSVLGVLQLRNARDPLTGHTVAFGAYQQLVAESLASQAAVALHNRRLREQETALLRYKRDLQIGREIQTSFFPRTLPQPPGWEIGARFHPAREVAGDFYDVFALPNGRLALVIADACDKGVAAALFVALLRSLLRAFLQQYYYLTAGQPAAQPADPDDFAVVDDGEALLDAVRLTNAYVGSNHGDAHLFASLFLGVLDPESGELLYINCGQPPPLLQHAGGAVERLMPTGPAVGLLPDARFRVGHAQLERGARLLAYTDGVTEARDERGNLFGKMRLQELLDDGPAQETEALLDGVETAVYAHSATPDLTDDIALLALRRLP
jgi:sigma-B regulation protein RsbU (phosphoserine phosphatase)